MMRRISDVHGFSLVEVVVAAVIFMLSVAGIFAGISSISQPVTVSDKTLKASLFAKKTAEFLRQYVRKDTWDQNGNLLKVPGPYVSGVDFFVGDTDFPGYTATVSVSDAGGGLRKVVIDVSMP